MKILKHIIPVKDTSPVLISTGTEKQLPYVVSKDWVIRGQDDGVVKDINEKTKMVLLEYKNGAREVVNLNPVVVKNGGGGFYLSNVLTMKYKKGQKFKKNDIIAYNKDYFSEHYDGTKFNIGTLCKVAIMSSYATFEDAKTITEGLSERMATEMVMQKKVILGPNATVEKIMKVGDDVVVGNDLIVYEQSNEEEEMNKMLSNIGDQLKEDIKAMGKSSLKSKYSGVIEDIRIYSTLDSKDLSPSLGKIVSEYWKGIKAKKEFITKNKITDYSMQGNTFYEVDGPIEPDATGKVKGYKIDEGVIIEFYIKINDPVGVGDKLCDFAALKGVVALVIPKGQEPYTLDTPDEEISTIFPATSVLARKVPSIIPTMMGNKLLIELKNQLKSIYETGEIEYRYGKKSV